MDQTMLRRINSMTKYPSIPTYHKMDLTNGNLLPETEWFHDGDVIVTEKIDGTNARIVVLPDGDWFIGSREELLCAKGDRVINPAMGIVDAVRHIANALGRLPHGEVTVYFGEVYGHNINGKGGRQYVSDRSSVDFRIFDIAIVAGYDAMVDWPVERIATWRDADCILKFVPQLELDQRCLGVGLDQVPHLMPVKRDSLLRGQELPTDIAAMWQFMSEMLPATQASIDGTSGMAEGIILRHPDRSVIAKARFDDYNRALKRMGVKF